MKPTNLLISGALAMTLTSCCCASAPPISSDILSATPLPTRTPRPTRTHTPTPAPTATLAPTSTRTPRPTPTPIPGPRVIIARVNKTAEYVDLENIGTDDQDLTGWILTSERGNQTCTLAGTIEPGQTLRIYAGSGEGGYNCGYDENIWNNDERDTAILTNADGLEIDRK